MIARSFPSPTSGARGPFALGLLVLACTLGSHANAQTATPRRTIPWRTDFALALAESRAKNLPLWVQFTGPWCPHCQRMDRETFARPEIVSLAAERMIPVKLQSDVHEDLTERLQITGLPATVILSPTGAVLAHHEGFEEAQAFKTILDQALAKAPRPAPSEAAGSKVAQLAMAGYCPVTLICRRKLEPGAASLTIQHQGREYRFASLASLEAFRKNPEAYSPANAGRCPVRSAQTGKNVPGDPHFGVVYAGRLHLCADAEARKLFIKDPQHYTSARLRPAPHPDLVEAEFCPHCRAESGQLVRGVPRYSTTYAGRRYMFPDKTHLAAFEADPDKYLR